MKVILHYPEEGKERAQLKKKAADAFAEAAISYIEGLHCSAGEKAEICGALAKAFRKKGAKGDLPPC